MVEGPAGNQSYKLKPVLHLVETAEAATIEGLIANSSFVGSYVVIGVLDNAGREYTTVRIDKDTTAGATETAYSIFWLVPNQAYTVLINDNPGLDDDPNVDGIQDGYDDSFFIPPGPSADYPDGTLQPGEIYTLDLPLSD